MTERHTNASFQTDASASHLSPTARPRARAGPPTPGPPPPGPPHLSPHHHISPRPLPPPPPLHTQLPDPEKGGLKAALLAALADPHAAADSKIGTALSMVVSAIYQSDEWPELLPALVGLVSGGGGAASSCPVAVAGAVRALALIADDVADDAAVAAAPVLLPAMRALAVDTAAPPLLRTQALNVGSSVLGALAVARGVGGAGGAAVRRVVDQEVGPWLVAVAGVLREGRAAAGDGGWALQLEGLRLATRAAAAFPRAAAPAAPDVAAATWAALGSALPEHVRTAVGSGTPLDADGCGGTDGEGEDEDEAAGPAALVTAALEFFALAAASRPGLPPSSLPDLLAACLMSMRVPREARAAWAGDGDAFVGDEDDDAAGARGAGEVLLATAVLGDDGGGEGGGGAAPASPEALSALAGAVRGALDEAAAMRAARAPGWWLPREAALLALGAVRDALASPGTAAVGLDANAIMAACLAADLPGPGPPAGSEEVAAAAAPLPAPPPLLAARALWLAARLAPCLDAATAGAALAAAAVAASPASPPPVQAQACRALGALVPAGGGGAAPGLAQIAPAAAGGVVGILEAGSLTDRALALALDALAALAGAGAGGAGPGGAPAAAAAALRAWAGAAADPLVGPAAEGAVLALASHPSTQDATFSAALPTLAGVVRAPSQHGGTVLTAALALLAGMMAVAPAQTAAAGHAAITPPALALIAARGGGDAAACRAACDYVRALARAGGPPLLAPPGALAALAGPLVSALIAPPPPGVDVAEAADAAGRAVPALTSLLRRAPPECAGPAVREAALAAAARLACADTPAPLGAALVGLLARGVLSDPAGMVAALAAAPLPPAPLTPLPPGVPTPDPAVGLLAPALTAWFARAAEVVGAMEICLSTAALGKIALSPPHPALDSLSVPGAPLHDAAATIRTRARARAAGPQAWSALPARAKALALLADIVLEDAEGGGGGCGADADDDGWESASSDDDENDENDEPSPGGRSSVAAALARGDGSALFAARLGCGWEGEEGEEGDADADADTDPADPLAAARPGELAAADLRLAAQVNPAGLAACAGLLSAGQRAAVEAAVRG